MLFVSNQLIFDDDRILCRPQHCRNGCLRLVVICDAVRLRVAQRVVVREEETAFARAGLRIAIPLALTHVLVAVDGEPAIEAERAPASTPSQSLEFMAYKE